MRLRNAEFIMDMKKQNMGSTADLAKAIYKDEMQTYTSNPIQKTRNNRSPFATRIPDEWESSPLNDRSHYNRSPAVKHANKKGDFSPDRYRTRTFNRKMKMVDSFTRILPAYDHVPNTCYTKAATHVLHPHYQTSIEETPMHEIDRTHTHKFDPIKDYSESMYKLGVFAPAPRKAALVGPGAKK